MSMTALIRKGIFIALGVTILAIAVNLFLGPHHIAAGGVTGLAIILEQLLNLDRSAVVMVFNMIILVITYIFLGKNMFLNTVIGGTLLPVMMGIIPQRMLVQDVMLSMIFGSILFGIGVSILFKNEASSGGTSIPPLIFKKYFNLSTSVGLLATDSIIVTMSIFVFGVESFFFAILSIIITAFTMNYVEDGLNKKKALMIISDYTKEVLDALLNEVQKGVTVVPVKGGYRQEEREMLMVVLSSQEYQKSLRIIRKYDPNAFVVTYNVSDVQGLGFTYDSPAI